MLGTANLKFSKPVLMRELDPAAFGRRVAARRDKLGMSQEELAEKSGQSQSNIGWIENGGPRRKTAILGHAEALAKPLQTSREWLLWERGPEHVGPAYLPKNVFAEHYDALPDDLKAALSEALAKLEKNGGKRGARK